MKNKYHNYDKNKKCPDCKKLITDDSMKCGSCRQKGTHFSKSHKKSLSVHHANFKGKKHPFHGKHHTKKAKLKISDAVKKRFENPKERKKMSKLKIKQYKKNPKLRKKISLSLGGTGISFEYIKYPYEFYLIRKNILERDEYVCQKCKKIGNCVHHIDYNKQNCENYNLITLCNGCNTKVNFNRDYWYAYFTYIMEEKLC